MIGLTLLRQASNVPPWLRTRARRMALSPDLFEAYAAVGVLARFAPQVELLARQYTKALDDFEVREMAWDACQRISVMGTDLEALDTTSSLRAGVVARALCHNRDDLESVAWLLRAAGKAEGVDRALRFFDHAAVRRLPRYQRSLPEDDLAQAVAQLDGTLWWGVSKGDES